MTKSSHIRPAMRPADERQFRADLLAVIPSLRAYARSLCYNRDLADDLTQEALTKSWAARASYLPGSNFRGWMFRILRNHYFSTTKVSRRFVTLDTEVIERLLVTPATQEAGLNLEDLQRGLATLPAEQREALLLMESGLRCEDIAGIMSTPVGTVKSRISRGRAALRLYMDGQGRALPASGKTVAKLSGPSRRLPPAADDAPSDPSPQSAPPLAAPRRATAN